MDIFIRFLIFTSAFRRNHAIRTLVTLGYIGSRGIHLIRNKEANQAIATRVSGGRYFFPANSARRNPAFGSIRVRDTDGNSWYNGMILGVIKRFGSPFAFRDSYDAKEDYLRKDQRLRNRNWAANLVKDALNFKLDKWDERGKDSTSMSWEMAGDTMLSVHVSEIPQQLYKKACALSRHQRAGHRDEPRPAFRGSDRKR